MFVMKEDELIHDVMFQQTPIGQEHGDSAPHSAWQRSGPAPDEETEVQILHGHVT